MKANETFVTEFLEHNSTRLNRAARKYLIPNRYDIEDVKQYIATKMLDIMEKRKGSDNPIEEPVKYFSSCIDFYCIEYQREHGFIFGLPRRPRKNCEIDEQDARSKGFKYLSDVTVEESLCLVDNSFESTLQENLPVSAETEVWTILTGCLSPEESDVLACIYLRGMTWVETSVHLGVAQSTCWSWKNRGLKNILNRFETMEGYCPDNVVSVLRAESGAIDAFTGALV